MGRLALDRLAVAAFAIVMTGAAAEPGWFSEPPPPSGYGFADIDAWVKAYIVVGDYLQTGYNRQAVGFLSTKDVDVTGPHQVRIWLRFENFRPVAVGDSSIRSARILTEFDCSKELFRYVGIEMYTGANLTGMPSIEDNPRAAWQSETPDTVAAVNGQVLCALMTEAQKDLP